MLVIEALWLSLLAECMLICGLGENRTHDPRIKNPLLYPSKLPIHKPKSIFFTYCRYRYILLAPATLQAENALVMQTDNLEQFLPTMGAYSEPFAVALVGLVCIFLCNYVHIGILSTANLSPFSRKTKYLGEKITPNSRK